METTDYLRPDDAARYLGTTTSTLAKWRISGEGPAFAKMGPRLVTYARRDLDTWLESRRRKSTSDAGK